MNYQKIEKDLLQGDENEAADLFNRLMRQSVRLGLLAALEEEVTELCGPRYKPDKESSYHRAGSETGFECRAEVSSFSFTHLGLFQG